MHQDIFGLLIFLAILPCLVMFAVYSQVMKMTKPEEMMFSLPEGLDANKQGVIERHRDWLVARQLQYLTAFRFGQIVAVVFQQTGAPRFLSFYFVNETWKYDLVTRFNGRESLTTASGNSAFSLPRTPGAYLQSFTGVTLDDLWQRHVEAEAYLLQKFHITWETMTVSYLDHVMDGIRRQAQHIRSIALWPVVALYGYFVKRHRMVNCPVQSQYP